MCIKCIHFVAHVIPYPKHSVIHIVQPVCVTSANLHCVMEHIVAQFNLPKDYIFI